MSAVEYGENGQNGTVLGIIEDITKEQTMALALEEAKSKDLLTGLWNREAGTRIAQEYMAQKPLGERCALMLLDMDNFTRINQEEGVAFANAVLQEVADILRAETEPDDIRVRMGGDEFMLVLKGRGKAGATVTGPRVAARVRELLLQSDKDISISVSIGMCATEVVDEYSGLYRCAESTLKYVKENCQGNAACYLDTSNELGEMLTDLYTEKHQLNTIEQGLTEQREDLVSFALDLLGKARNLNDAVQLLFARLGKTFGLDRVSLLDVDRDYLTCRFSYQWARDKTDLMMHKTFYITREQYEQWPGQFDPSGLNRHAVYDESSMSCLQAAIWNQGMFAGILSFEVKTDGYSWNDEQRKLLEELSKIIPSFVMKARADAVSQAKTDFLSRMSHEIRTPLNAIVGFSNIIAEIDDEVERQSYLDIIHKNNDLLLQLIDDILDFSKIEAGTMDYHFEEVDIKDICGEIALADSIKMPSDVVLIFDLGSPSVIVKTDERRVMQVISNFVNNAIKFTTKGSITIYYEIEGDFIRVCVKDTGIGISAENQRRIFERFIKVDTFQQGTGLGLTISRTIIEALGGKIGVDSEEGVGSTFWFTLPLDTKRTDIELSPDIPVQSEETPRSDRHHSILIAEDVYENYFLLETLFGKQYQLYHALNGQEAIDMFETYHPDLILMDIKMPVMDGFEATRRIRTLSKTIPIIALTAFAFEREKEIAKQCEFTDYVVKPIDIKELKKLIVKVLA